MLFFCVLSVAQKLCNSWYSTVSIFSYTSTVFSQYSLFTAGLNFTWLIWLVQREYQRLVPMVRCYWRQSISTSPYTTWNMSSYYSNDRQDQTRLVAPAEGHTLLTTDPSSILAHYTRLLVVLVLVVY